jgi:hypothetical protein
MHHLSMRKRAGRELNREAGDTAEDFVLIKDLFRHRLRVTDEQRARGAACGVELRPRDGWPAAFLVNLGEGTCVRA